MSFLPTLGSIIDAGSGVLLIALGVWVGLLRPRRKSTSSFAVFSIAFGLTWLLANLPSEDDPLYGLLVFVSGLVGLVAAGALARLALSFPRPLRDRRLGAAAALAALLFFGAAAGQLLLRPDIVAATYRVAPDQVGFALAYFAMFLALQTAFWFALVLFALRFAAAKDPGAERRRDQARRMSLGLLLYPGLLAGMEARAANSVDQTWGFLGLGLLGLVALLWLRSTRTPWPASRGARDLALLALALPLAGLVLTPMLGDYVMARNAGPLGLARFAAVGTLGYAIVRTQLLDADGKVRVTLRRSTVAAVFVGVFFMVSEGAAAFFSTGLGPVLGLLAAGALVFALAPLERLADRVSVRAVPPSKPPEQLPSPERAALYREQAELAWADGKLDPQERAMLDRLRERLGLGLEEAFRLEQEALGSEEPPTRPPATARASV